MDAEINSSEFIVTNLCMANARYCWQKAESCESLSQRHEYIKAADFFRAQMKIEAKKVK